MATVDAAIIPGYRVGTWKLDADHSEVRFSVKHLMISRIHGTFGVASAELIAPANPLDASVEATVDAASVDTKNQVRDKHLRSEDFLDAQTHPTLSFRSTGVRIEKDQFLVDGDLSIHGVTKPATFTVDFGGFATDSWGTHKAGAFARTVIDREEFGLLWNAALETGGVVVGKEVTIELELQGTFVGE